MANYRKKSHLRIKRKGSVAQAYYVFEKGNSDGVGFWTAIEKIWSGCAKILTSVVLLASVVLFIYILYQSVTRKVISIEMISVPDDLNKSGFTQMVAAQRLERSLDKIFYASQTSKSGPDVLRQDENSKIIVPSTGLSVEALASFIRRFFSLETRWNVSGDITLVKNKFWLTILLNGEEIYVSKDGIDPDQVGMLFDQAARRILEQSDPYILASSLSKDDPATAVKIAASIIAKKAGRLGDRPWAYNLLGKIRRDKGDIDGAIKYYDEALKIDPKFDVALRNICLAYSDKSEFDDAIHYCQAAIRNKPDRPGPYGALCYVYLRRSNEGMDDQACSTAVQKYEEYLSSFHFDTQTKVKFGILLRNLLRFDYALKILKEVNEIEPRDARNHVDMGITLLHLNRIGEAGNEFLAAIDIDPDLKIAHRLLSKVLGSQGCAAASEAEIELAKSGHE